MLLVDWELDDWTRIYTKVLKNATLAYSFCRKLASEGSYSEKFDKI